jgi:parallel beta-helix repeat protein
VVTGSNKTIDAKRISSSSCHCIEIRGAKNIVIKNSVIGSCKGNGIYIVDSDNIEIRNNNLEQVKSGVYAVNSTRINVHHNRFLNMMGPFPRGQYVQFNNVDGGGNRINYNEGESRLGQSYPEDLVNLYKSKGNSNDPIQIVGNRFKGGGPSKSGGGIMAGDNDGGNVLVENNILVDPGQYGIAIAGGDGVRIVANKVYGKKQDFTNVGIYVWRQKNTASCSGHAIANNEVLYYNKAGSLNSAWNAGNCGTVTGWNSNNWKANIGDWIYQGLGVSTLLDQPPGNDNTTEDDSNDDSSDQNTTQRIEKLFLVQADNQTVLGELTPNSRWESSDNALSVIAQATLNSGSLHFNLTGPIAHYQTEKLTPYALFGDNTGDPYGRVFPAGNYELKVTPMDQYGNAERGAKSIPFSIVEADTSSAFNRLELIDANTNKYIGIVRDGDQLSISGRNISMKAIVEESIDHVTFTLTGPMSYSRKEGVPPYALFGDGNHNFNGRKLPAGSYLINVKLYRSNQTISDTHIRFEVN